MQVYPDSVQKIYLDGWWGGGQWWVVVVGMDGELFFVFASHDAFSPVPIQRYNSPFLSTEYYSTRTVSQARSLALGKDLLTRREKKKTGEYPPDATLIAQYAKGSASRVILLESRSKLTCVWPLFGMLGMLDGML